MLHLNSYSMMTYIYFKKINRIINPIILILFTLCSCNKNSTPESETIIDILSAQLSWDIPCEGSTVNVDITTNIDWSIETDETTSAWINVSPAQGTAGTYKLEITVAANESEEQRTGTLTVLIENYSKNIIITQEGKVLKPESGSLEDMPIEEWK